MKKFTALAAAMLLAFASMAFLAGCGSSGEATMADFVGSYVFEQVTSDSGSYTAEEIESIATAEQMCTLELKEDGTWDMSTFGNSVFTDGSSPTWSVSGNEIVLTSSDTQLPVTYDTDGHTITIDYEGSKMILKRVS